MSAALPINAAVSMASHGTDVTRNEIITEFRDSMIMLMAKELPDEQWFKQAYDLFVLARDREIFWEKIQKIRDDLHHPPS